MMSKDITADKVVVGQKGEAGVAGKDGEVGVKGADGSAVVLNGKDGSIGLNGTNGTNGLTIKGATGAAGVDGAPGETKTRIEYVAGGKTEVVATLNDGMKFGGDSGNAIAKKLNEQVNVVGGVTEAAKLSTADNIGVISDGANNLTIRLAKELTGLDKVTTGSVVVPNTATTAGAGNVVIDGNGINAGNKVISNVASGGSVDTNAANIKDVKDAVAAATGSVTGAGLKFGANSGTEATNKLGSKVTVQGSGAGPDDNYTSSNIRTKVSQDTTTGDTTIEVMMSKDITADKLVVGQKGEAGAAGKDGEVGVKGADGSAVVLNGKDGSIGLNGKDGANGLTIKGADGAPGVNGTDGKTRIEYKYTDPQGVSHTESVATLNDGMKFGGDSGNVIAKKLNEQVNVVGGVTEEAKLSTANNVGVISDGANKLTIRLAKELTGLDKVTTGSVVVPNIATTAGAGNVVIDGNGINAGNKVISNVASGGTTETNAANIKDVKDAVATATSTLQTGLDAVTLNITGDNATSGSVNLKTQGLAVTGANGVTTTVANQGISIGLTQSQLTVTDGTVSTANAGDAYATAKSTADAINAVKTKLTDTVTATQNALTDKGLKFAANSGTEVTNKLGSKVTVQGSGAGPDDNYTSSNIRTKVTQDAQTGDTTIEVMMSKDITADKLVVGQKGEAGVAGKDGEVGVKGADGSAVVLNGKDGSIGLNGANGTNGLTIKGADGAPGVNGTDGKTRIEYKYTDPQGTTYTESVATLNDGMKFGGDSGTPIAKKLNEQVNVVGGVTDTANLSTANNVGVIAEGSNLTIRLAKELTGLDKVTAGAATLGKDATGNTTLTGLSNTTWDKTNAVDNRAATEGQLKALETSLNTANQALTDAAVTYDKKADGTVNKDQVTLAGANGTTITNLKDGNVAAGSKDAVNGGQLYNVQQSVVAAQNALTDKGLKFAANSGTEVTNKLGSKVTVQGSGAGPDDNYTSSNIRTKVTQDAQTGDTTIEVMMSKDITADKLVVGQKGDAGAAGKDGEVGVKGADGSAVVLNGKDGSIGLNGKDGANGLTIKGADGAPGVNGTDGKTRIEYKYTDPQGTTHTESVATLNDGMKFGGDSGTPIAKKLNEQVNVVGGVTDTANLSTANNVGVIAEGSNLTIRLAKELTGLDKVTAGAATLGKDATGNTTLTGLSNTTWDKANAVDNRAATEGQLKALESALNDGSVTYAKNTDGTVNKDLVTLGGANGTLITNLKDGNVAAGSKDAVTGGQLYNVQQSVVTAQNALTEKGLKFGANSGDAVTNKLGTKVTVQGSGAGPDDNYTSSNIRTKVTQDAQTGDTTIEVMMSKDITADKLVVGQKGEAGVAGKDGEVGVKGADGSAVVLNGKDGSIGLNGANGTNGLTIKGADGAPGVNGTDGKTRIEYKYTDPQGATHTESVATLNDGMKFGGDSGTAIAKKLNEQVNVVGGIADATKLTVEDNIGVVASDAGLKVRLAKDLKLGADGSVSFGDTIMNNAGMTIKNADPNKTVSLTNAGLNNGGNKITNLADGTEPTDAATVGQMNTTIAAAAAKATTKVTAGKNVVVTPKDNTDGSKTYEVAMADHVTLGTGANAVDLDGTKGTITAGTGEKAVTIDGTKGTITAGTGANAVTVDGTKGEVKANTVVASTVTGLTNTTWNPDTAVAGRAATEGQLKEISNTISTTTANVNAGWEAQVNGTKLKDVTPNSRVVNYVAGDNMMITGSGNDIKIATKKEVAFDKVTTGNTVMDHNGVKIGEGDKAVSLTQDGLNNGGNRITNVGHGKEDTDAATIGQLKSVLEHQNDWQPAVKELGAEIRDVGASTAALAGLKPIQYDPYEPTQIMAAVGNYRNSTAAAIGLAHFTSESLMVHAGMTLGGSHNAVNAGVTWRFGDSSKKDHLPEQYRKGSINSAYAMIDEMQALKLENENLRKNNEETKATLDLVLKRLEQLESK